MQVRYGVENGFLATITGGHRQCARIRQALGFDPWIHSGMAGRGRAVCKLTQAEFDFLKAQGIKLAKRRTTPA